MKHDPNEGRQILTRKAHEIVAEFNGEISINKFLKRLQSEGYHPTALRAIIPKLGLIEENGMVRVKSKP